MFARLAQRVLGDGVVLSEVTREDDRQTHVAFAFATSALCVFSMAFEGRTSVASVSHRTALILSIMGNLAFVVL